MSDIDEALDAMRDGPQVPSDQPITATEVNQSFDYGWEGVPSNEIRDQIMAATPCVWSNFGTDNACPTGIITTTSDTHPFPAQEWVDNRAAELTGLVNFEISTSTTGLERLSEIMRELQPGTVVATHTDVNFDLTTNDTTTTVNFDIFDPCLDENREILPPAMDPQEMESSSPLRADDDQNDTLGQEFDNSFEMGEAEEWFRSKIQVRP